ncbi:MAG: Lrp/AsnC family transcriptional regulator [Desulfobacteraceae bacterium]|jgi:Lrp/AsnC family transcriptional regulator for asnA, asnC and gidA|nr:Lrp/AsnC family transcriptional regulator [Desulfobacteraceae bacterium]
MKLDETTISIIRHLREGRKSFRAIADSLSLSENTVRQRVRKLVDEDVLEITGLVDPEAMPDHTVCMIGVQLDTLNLVEKAKEFAELKGVVSASVVTGRYDLMLVVLLKEDFNLLDFYTKEVYRLKGIRSVETFVVYKGYNLKVPYVH